LLLFGILKTLVCWYEIVKEIKSTHFSKFNLFYAFINRKIIILYFSPRAPPTVDSKNLSR